jgi:hypothetical protein
MIERSPRVCACTATSSELPRCFIALFFCGCRAVLSWQREARVRRCGKPCYVVDIYWPGLLRASETLSITKNAAFRCDFQGSRGVGERQVTGRTGVPGADDPPSYQGIGRQSGALGFLVAVLSLNCCNCSSGKIVVVSSVVLSSKEETATETSEEEVKGQTRACKRRPSTLLM